VDYNLEASRILDADHTPDPELGSDGCLEGACLTCGYAVGWREDSDDVVHTTLASVEYVRTHKHF
jgi:hypothetical protein